MKLKNTVSSAVICTGLWLGAGSAAYADVQVQMQNGHVSVIAKDATLRQILTEWARVGQTLELRDVPEERALEILLRTLSGYMAAPRPAQAPNLSRFDRIVVMPTVAAARQPATASTSSAPPVPVFQPPPMPMPQPAEDDDPATPPGPNSGPPRPVFSTFPQPQVVNPNAAPGNFPQPGFVPPPGMAMPVVPTSAQPPTTPAGVPTVTGGVPVPGMIVPAPQQPGQPTNPNQPRRPGGLQDQ